MKEYEGKDLYSIGIHFPGRSRYNHNFYRLPNGEEVLLVSDDDGWNDVFLVDGDKLTLVGGQYDDGGFMLGSFT